MSVLAGLLVLGAALALGFGLGYVAGTQHEHQEVEDLIQDQRGFGAPDGGFGHEDRGDRQGPGDQGGVGSNGSSGSGRNGNGANGNGSNDNDSGSNDNDSGSDGGNSSGGA